MRAARALTSLACLTACTERAELTALPEGIAWMVVVRTSSEEGEQISPLLRVEDGSIALAVGPDETLDLWGYGDEIAPRLAGVPSSSLQTERMRDGTTCEPTLPAPRWSTHVSASRALTPLPSYRAWTAGWLDDQCADLDPATLRVALGCAVGSCGVVRVRGCELELELGGCGRGVVRGRVGTDGEICLIPPTEPELGMCAARTEPPLGAVAGLMCDLREGASCTLDLYVSPEDPPIDLDLVRFADPAPESVGPDENDFGIHELSCGECGRCGGAGTSSW